MGGNFVRQVCPVCSFPSSSIVETMPLPTLDRAYRKYHGIPVEQWFPPTTTDVLRLECESCGLGHFSPSVAGSGSFYADLSEYASTRWEFDVAAQLVRGKAVLDIGCGSGVFLRSIAGLARTRVGNDLNPDVAAGLSDAGIEGEIGGHIDLRDKYQNSFDFVTAFQVLEHLERPLELFVTARAVLKPSGHLMISVPNADRLIFDRRILPLDWPPHHVTRWKPNNLEEAGRLTGFALQELAHQPTHSVYRRLRHLPPPIAIPLAASVALLRGGRVNWKQMRHESWKSRGHSVLAIFTNE